MWITRLSVRIGVLVLSAVLGTVLGGMHVGCSQPPRDNRPEGAEWGGGQLGGGGSEGILTFAEYRGVTHGTPYVIEGAVGEAALLYYGVAHFNSAEDPQAADIVARWEAFKPTMAFNEGGDPPVGPSAEIAIGLHGEAGLLRWLAARDGVPIRSLDPTREAEATELRTRFTAEELTVFYVLRSVMQDAQRGPAFRQASIEVAVERWLGHLARYDALAEGPVTLAGFEASCRALAPGLTDWRTVPASWFDPTVEPPVSFTNEISRASSEFRDRHIVTTLLGALHGKERVFGVVGASHVVMQEPALRMRLTSATTTDGSSPGVASGGERRVVSLSGRALVPPPIPDERREELLRRLAECTASAASPSAVEDDFIWLGRTLGYLHRYFEAIDVLTRGLERFPESPKLLRHRGHRLITVREFDRARRDLERAAAMIADGRRDEIELDGAPNRSGIPRSTLHTNIYYHLGLAHYLNGDFQAAAEGFASCAAISPNDDMTVAATYWLSMSRRRAGDDAGARESLARIRADMQILENEAYYRLCRMQQGVMTPEEVLPRDDADAIGVATVGYGIANWYWCEGDRERAREWLERTAASPMWPAFGVIAAEAELARGAGG